LGFNEPSFTEARRRRFFLVSELMKRKVSHGQDGDRKNDANQLWHRRVKVSPKYAKGEQGLTIVFDRFLSSLLEWFDQTFSNFSQFLDLGNIGVRSKGAIS
jgi:hypothetical protein